MISPYLMTSVHCRSKAVSSVFKHRPVLLDEVMAGLKIKPEGVYVDGTFGRGGHAKQILGCLGERGRLIAFDKDPEAIQHAEDQLGADPRFSIVNESFATIGAQLSKLGLCGRVDGVFLDLGVSSPQLDDASRGFSFQADGPLDMRMDPMRGVSAEKWIEVAKEGDIIRVLKDYGDERYAKKIAAAIVRERALSPIQTTLRLAEIVAAVVPVREINKHPATRTFQAIRIQVNNELEDLESFLPQAVDVLANRGRLAIISFHSLEDRIVKRFFREKSIGDYFPPDFPVTADQLNPVISLVGKAIKAGADELKENIRSRSATLRLVEKGGC